ncbi:siderophore ABC transporter substrate-binding protein [Jeotgalibaca sp. MA1X17-3]|uniref:siderophore ABC transporter substrate-binding protein n=1 Tax=Jeotgalibaca sp. MA1X17-3 TaxID=2908211 RepID=UPI001F425194|nr:siderophore ABC transporter substrate-binding protein [Jeotgalibaca sp. MA1X17-3]UJF16638.1 siderophore ABC transporter substrate-binding protein [Jeotgalibaca sp. MA1X17-3]
MKKNRIGLMIVGAVLFLTACGETEQSSSVSSSDVTSELIEVEDSNGKVNVPLHPEKVVVFDNSMLDTMDALGVGESVIAAPTTSLPDYLSDYKQVESAGGIKEPDLEKINQMQPDLIIISNRQIDYQEQLEEIAPTLFLSLDNKNIWSSIQKNIQTIGTVFGKEQEVANEIESLQTQMEHTKKEAEDSGKKALILLINEGSLSAYGPGSRFGIIHETLGFEPADDQIEASTHGQNVSYEYVLEQNPDIIFVIDRTKAIGGDASNNNLADNELVKQTTAFKEGAVITLDPQVWYLAGSGIESLELMLKDVQQAIE